ncbi:Predicted glycosyl hydrolase, GH43/DUF377 family [Amphibacillus marinus]|uniref:Predicted glycosyl hydrolase, GH43/DUF377 family n=1 Tax=Amphibacillus marinus TaxID=872970 RepID=A0A1H8QCG9_9BACI|nr:glycoside hydrolase family 130 protein [Amphibacillus marinus]SEO51925.1 Predicted glycosyl hydrolase, GH43/DUF377 family [Amphibacillus marinus]
MNIDRHDNNPIITTSDIEPSRSDFKVDGVFNAAATKYGDEIILLLRVAESLKETLADEVTYPVLEQDEDGNDTLVIKTINKVREREHYDFSDARVIYDRSKKRKTVALTSISHLRLARSKDGVHFEIDQKPTIFPQGKYETWGIEDPRITQIEGVYYINYTAVSPLGAGTALIKTTDFITFERVGLIFPPENKDVSLFPEKINGKYVAYHRPVPNAFGNPDIWLATSPDLISWGEHKHLLSVQEEGWENGRIGGGAPSFKNDKGWIHIYHAADHNNRYCLGAFITDINDPSKIIAKTNKPILEPEALYEVEGFFGNVVFTCGVINEHDKVKIYYGASDEVMALAEIGIEEIYDALGIN